MTEKALKIALIRKIENQSSASWEIILNLIVKYHGDISFLTSCNYDTKKTFLLSVVQF